MTLAPLPTRDFEQLVLSSDVEAAWAAGFFDGDGSVGIYPSVSRETLVLKVSVAQSGPVPPLALQVLADRWEGGVSRAGVSKVGGQQKWQWRCGARKAEKFLRDISPFVVAKRERVLLALEYREKALGRGNSALQQEYRERLGALVHRPPRSTARPTVEWPKCAS